MAIPSHERERLDKLRALADRGATEGERNAAKLAIGRICKKYGVETPDEYAAEEPDIENMTFAEMRDYFGNLNEVLGEMLDDIGIIVPGSIQQTAAAFASMFAKSGKP